MNFCVPRPKHKRNENKSFGSTYNSYSRIWMKFCGVSMCCSLHIIYVWLRPRESERLGANQHNCCAIIFGNNARVGCSSWLFAVIVVAAIKFALTEAPFVAQTERKKNKMNALCLLGCTVVVVASGFIVVGAVCHCCCYRCRGCCCCICTAIIRQPTQTR